jgi:hypothetical protein
MTNLRSGSATEAKNRDSFPRLMAGLGVTIDVWSAVPPLPLISPIATELVRRD